jgi:cysteine-rich repeat protein
MRLTWLLAFFIPLYPLAVAAQGADECGPLTGFIPSFHASGEGTDDAIFYDLDQDGDVDVIWAHGAFKEVIIGYSQGDKVDEYVTLSVTGVTRVAAGDIDGDNAPDLLLLDEGANLLRLHLNTGGRTFGAEVASFNGQFASNVHLVDMDADNQLDLVFNQLDAPGGNHACTAIAIGGGVAGFAASFCISGLEGKVRSGDLNGDQLPDLVLSTNGAMLLNQGGGNFAAPVSLDLSPFDTVTALGLTDLDGDGDLDIVSGGLLQGSFQPGVMSLLNDGSGNFTACGEGVTSGEPLAVTDFNGDGQVDVASADTGSSPNQLGLALQETCGNGIQGPGEECDDGNLVNGDQCTHLCLNPVCGDDVVSAGEECDDGNTINGDGCSDACELPVCGDNIVEVGEECDDGNTDPNDACTNQCTNARCGDGVTQTGAEQCDDGNSLGGDGCDQCNLDDSIDYVEFQAGMYLRGN